MNIFNNWLERTEMMLSSSQIEKLKSSNVLVVGLGGVGGAAAEMLVRGGIGKMTIIDGDTIHNTNRNRQLIALHDTVGKEKALEWEKRLLKINPDLELTVISEFIKDERMKDIINQGFDYVVDAIDTLSPKVFLIFHSTNKSIPVVSSMGAGGKFDPVQIKIVDISESHTCQLAYKTRKKLNKLGIKSGIKVVFSPELVPANFIKRVVGEKNKISTVGTISYLPVIFGCFCASVVIRDLINLN